MHAQCPHAHSSAPSQNNRLTVRPLRTHPACHARDVPAESMCVWNLVHRHLSQHRTAHSCRPLRLCPCNTAAGQVVQVQLTQPVGRSGDLGVTHMATLRWAPDGRPTLTLHANALWRGVMLQPRRGGWPSGTVPAPAPGALTPRVATLMLRRPGHAWELACLDPVAARSFLTLRKLRAAPDSRITYSSGRRGR